ncbi:MAG: hypothetical protein F2876_04935 [Actinobacteria bacterium]|nr:hypothetical protein [Actinomycetota bacterium]
MGSTGFANTLGVEERKVSGDLGVTFSDELLRIAVREDVEPVFGDSPRHDRADALVGHGR